MRQEDVADRMGMSRENLSKIERGLVTYGPNLVLLAKIYDCSRSDLLERDPFLGETLVDGFRRLDPDLQAHLMRIAETFSKKTG